MMDPRACRSPSLFGADWWPLLTGRLIQRTRGSAMAVTTCSESSLHPSPTTNSSKSLKFCRSTLPIEYGSTLLQLYVGMITVTRGAPARADCLGIGAIVLRRVFSRSEPIAMYD